MNNKTLFYLYSVNFLINASIQGSIVFLSILGSRMGASNLEIGFLGAGYGFAYLVFSLVCGPMSDRLGKLRFVQFGLLFCTLAFASQFLAHRFLFLVLSRTLVGLFLGIATTALVAYAYESGVDFGRFSAFGAMGWIAASVAAALLQDFYLAFLFSSISCAGAFFLSLFLMPGPAGVKTGSPQVPSLVRVLRRGLPVYLSVFMRQLGAHAVWLILPLYFVSLKISLFWIGMLWVVNFIAQSLIMPHIERFDPNKIFAAGQFLSVLVFICYMIADKLLPLVFTQVLLGFAWSFLYVGGLLLVFRSGEERGTASGIFQATLNLCGALGPLLGGIAAQAWGYRGVMAFAAALGIAGLLLSAPGSRRHKHIAH